MVTLDLATEWHLTFFPKLLAAVGAEHHQVHAWHAFTAGAAQRFLHVGHINLDCSTLSA
jgi:hypothetical protein